jgi:hypothetical protein
MSLALTFVKPALDDSRGAAIRAEAKTALNF